ncbi:hypothetical protein TRFO_27405 [Tritrichomonas foetus]|uniref:Uncharacterized protein n=1 Tax=Tritrichomonas foetus TaxID=1144522 RepID=A0A1J4K151_9EUKA|nr:hypothetical protein TRFO_27405 [Tritrichomonas foetus]|eukprot:OHT04963.1 hypothetical protein TRFO_27405 [Tritrichomonas foetus]
MDVKKTPNHGVLDEEILQIETDFKQIFGEMCELVSNPMFTDIFRQLHALLMNSHKKNKKLTEIVQVLNGNVVSNATKVASLLKMSEDDQLTIDRYKEEYNRAWKLVNSSQEKESQALSLCEKMREEINNLTEAVHEQSVSENKFNDIKTDINSFMEELKNIEHEYSVVTSDMNQMNAKLSIALKGKERARAEVEDLEISIQNEEIKFDKAHEKRIEYQKEIDSVSFEAKDYNDIIANNVNQIKELHKNINDNRQEIIRYRSVKKEYQNDYDTIYRKIKTATETRDRVLHSVNKNLSKVRYMTQKVEEANAELDKQQGKNSKMDEILLSYEDELNEAKEYANEVKNKITDISKVRKDKNQQIIDVLRANGVSEAKIRQRSRENDFARRQIQKITTNLKNEIMDTKGEAEITSIVDNAVSLEKLNHQKEGIRAHDVELETKIYEQKTHEAKVQLVRLNDNKGIIMKELGSANSWLEKLEKSGKDHDKFIHEMRHERDIISNQIEGLVNENAEYTANIAAKNEELLQLKKDIQKRTEECISIHFQTRGVEKQINALNGMVDMTKRLCDEIKSTIVGYKAEGAKLRLIFDEAHKDINMARSELQNIEEVSRLIGRQLCRKRDEVEKASTEMKTLLHQMQRSYNMYEQQTDQINELNEELEQKIYQNRLLRQKSECEHDLEMEVITLETRLIHEKEIRNRFEEEFERPMNVHRWTMLQAMSPNIFKQITMIQFLKHKIELVVRKQIKLNEKKAQLQKTIEINNSRMKNCKIQDGQYALSIMKEAISRKDKELNEMENELKEKAGYMKEMKETVDFAKLKVKQSHIATSSLKRQMPKTEIPTLPINTPKFIERTRLGGGFNLSSQKDKINDKIPEKSARTPQTTRPVSRKKVNEDDFYPSSNSSSNHFSIREVSTNSDLRRKKNPSSNLTVTIDYPMSSRTVTAQTWKPKKNASSRIAMNQELSVKPAISVRPISEINSNRDSLRRTKPMKTAPKSNQNKININESDTADFNPSNGRPKSARRTKVTKERPAKSSRLSENSNSSLSSKRSVNVHIMTIDPF